jgi:hypothetical protein
MFFYFVPVDTRLLALFLNVGITLVLLKLIESVESFLFRPIEEIGDLFLKNIVIDVRVPAPHLDFF